MNKKQAFLLAAGGGILLLLSIWAAFSLQPPQPAPDSVSLRVYRQGFVTAAYALFTFLILAGLLLCVPALRNKLGLRLPALKRSEKLYLVFCFTLYFVWASTFVFYDFAPDEWARQEIPAFISAKGALPFGWEEELRNPVWGDSYGFDLSLAYLVSAYFMRLASLFSASQPSLIIASRLTSVLSGTGAAYLAILISHKLWGKNPIGQVYVVLLSLLPQLVLLSCYENRDIFSLFTVLFIVYSWIQCLEQRWRLSACLRLALALGLCFLSYQFAYGYILVSALLYGVWYLLHRKQFPLRDFLGRGMLILAVAFAVSGWYFIRNAVLYKGDFLSIRTFMSYRELYALDEFKPSLHVTYRGRGLSILGMLEGTQWTRFTWQSLIGVYGGLNQLTMPEWIYDAYSYLFRAALLVFAVHSVFSIKTIPGDRRLLGCALVAAGCVAVFLSLYYSWNSDFQPQGRYIITILPALMALVTAGLNSLVQFILPANARGRRALGSGLAACVFLFVLYTMLRGFSVCLQAFVY